MDEATINLAEFICESDAIESIQDNPELLMRQIKIRKKDGHVGAMLLLEELVQSPLNSGGYVTDELVCRVQGLITAEQHKKPGGPKLSPELVGRYRSLDIWIKNVKCPAPEAVPSLMTELLKRTGWWQSNSRFQQSSYNLSRIARLHFEFEVIHPFADGTGRTGRALAYYLLRWAGLRPFIFTSRDKHESYYPCFADRGDPYLMEKYFLNKMNQESKLT